MRIMDRDGNIINLNCELFCFYNINCRLNVLVYGSWTIGDLESKVFQDGSECANLGFY